MLIHPRLHHLLALLISLTLGQQALTAAPAKPSRPSTGADAAAIRRQFASLSHATNAHDVAAIRRYLAPAFVTYSRAGAKLDREESLRFLGDYFHTFKDYREQRHIESLTVGGSTAKVTNSSIITFTEPSGKKARMKKRTLQTWRKIGGKWLLTEARQLGA